jgi:hypothetical protein
MSWDLLLLPLPAEVGSPNELPDDFRPDPLGSQASVQAALATIPGMNLADPSWGQLAGPNWSIELNIGRDDPVDSITLHVRGGSDEVLPAVFRIAAAVGCRAIDYADGEFVAPGAAGGWHAFQEYRDRVVPSA